jgi:hypothetical protein
VNSRNSENAQIHAWLDFTRFLPHNSVWGVTLSLSRIALEHLPRYAMRFRLADPLTGDRAEFGPVAFLRIHDNSLQDESQTEAIARFSQGQWQTPGKTYALLHVDGPVMASFEDGEHSESYGPFESVLIVAGLLRHGPDANAILARLDQESGSWTVGWEQRRYPTLVLEPT